MLLSKLDFACCPIQREIIPIFKFHDPIGQDNHLIALQARKERAGVDGAKNHHCQTYSMRFCAAEPVQRFGCAGRAGPRIAGSRIISNINSNGLSAIECSI
jgi:hypothetical protein